MCVGAGKKLKTSGQVSVSLFYREGIRPMGIKKTKQNNGLIKESLLISRCLDSEIPSLFSFLIFERKHQQMPCFQLGVRESLVTMR